MGTYPRLESIPGEFTIISGEDRGRSFRLRGYRTSEGAVATIGRREMTGEMALAHIRVSDMTVSRMQAEFIYTGGRLYVRNLSNTNYTRVDGRKLPPGQMAEVRDGSLIRMGKLELRYKALS